MSDFAERYDEASEEVLAELKKTLESVDPASLERLAQEILKADQVFFVGVGRVMLALQCVVRDLRTLESRLTVLARSMNRQSRKMTC